MITVLAEATPQGGGPGAVTLVTESLLALAAVVSALTPVILARRRARKDALAASAAYTASRGDLTLAGWTALNAALQQEINRLQGVAERMQARIDLLESEIAELQKLALRAQKDPPGA